jgi:hypothetical protein
MNAELETGSPHSRRRVPWWTYALALLVVCGRPAEAQCPDGSPQPCAPRVRQDTNLFLVLPFVVRSGPELLYLRESMVDLFHAALDGVAGHRVTHPSVTLRRLQRLSDPSDASVAAGVAREIGAGRILAGSITATGSRLQVRLDVFETSQGKQQFQLVARGEVSQLHLLVDSLVSGIVARRKVSAATRRGTSLEEYGTKSPAALQAFLIAEQLARRAERRIAAESLFSALRQDPDFGLAHYTLVTLEAAEGGVAGGKLAELLKTALERSQQFPERIKLLLAIQEAHRAGNRRVLTLADQAAARFPNNAEVARQRADVYWHFGMNAGRPREQIVNLFRRAFELDDGDPELLSHYVLLMAETFDTTATWAAARRCEAIASRPCVGGPALRAALRGEDPWRIAREDTLAFPNLGIIRFLNDNPVRGIALADSFAMIQTSATRSPTRRTDAYKVRFAVALARGRYRAASALADSIRDLGANYHSGDFRLLHNLVSATDFVRSENVFAIMRRNLAQGAQPPGISLLIKRAVHAWYATVRHSPDSAERTIADLESWPGWQDSAFVRATAAGLRGMLAARVGDTARARVLFSQSFNNHRRITISGHDRVMWPAAAISLASAQLEAAAGRPASASLHLNDMYPWSESLLLLGPAEELRAQVSLALGDTTSAQRAFRNVVTLWSEADSLLQPRVAAARAALAKLGNGAALP